MLEHRPPLDQLARAPGAQPIDDARLRAVPITDRGLLLVQGRPDDPVLAGALRRALALGLPGPLTANVREANAIQWLGPREWLIELPSAATAAVHEDIVATIAEANARAIAPTLTAVTDVSDAFAGFDIDGTHAVDVLMSGCSLDLTSVAAGSAMPTAVADVPAIIRSTSGGFRCWVDRSVADHFVGWLAESPARW